MNELELELNNNAFKQYVINLLIEIHLHTTTTNELVEQIISNQTNVPLEEVQKLTLLAFDKKKSDLFAKLLLLYGDLGIQGFFDKK